MACSSNSNTPYGLPSNGSPSIDPRATIYNPRGPGAANFQPEAPASSSTQPVAGSSTSSAAPMMHYLDIGTPNYAPAPNLSRIFFSNRADADPAAPLSSGIPITDFYQAGYAERMEDAAGFPLAAMYPGMENMIEVEVHWPGYMRYSVQIMITRRRWHFDQAYAYHITRSDLAGTVVGHVSRYVRIAQLESNMPSPVPLGTTSTEGVTPNDMILRSLDPMISPEGRVVWVPHFVARFPLGEGRTRPFCQRTRW